MAEAAIHPSAVIDPAARIGDGCEIGPFCVVGPQVELGEGVELVSHAVVAGRTTIGPRTRIFPFASIGEVPQDLKFRGEKVRLEIGARNRIREYVTMNPGTEGGGGVTRIGDDGLFMAGSHVAHDCQIGNRVILVNNASVAGHCVLEDDVIVGGLSGVHQWVRIGRGAMIGAVTMVTADVIPYGLVQGPRGHLDGLNLVGLKRRGASREDIHALRGMLGEGKYESQTGTNVYRDFVELPS
ncbi:MAG TPA: acyl-ACP--UDP-N-acetylglucosamine O-acyltransferase, partial [Paracoccus sp. (in: a-proteobacteria)]|nr:acyl-ACP--UDP-N-acetylglucosamine O-acyltransferase [Paracoccus sp. (in: a-proteobacteria)]